MAGSTSQQARVYSYLCAKSTYKRGKQITTISVSLFCVANIEVYSCLALNCIEAGVSSTYVQ